MTVRSLLAALAAVALTGACSDGPKPEPPPPCDQKCKDAIAVRGLRETTKLVFDLTLQGSRSAPTT